MSDYLLIARKNGSSSSRRQRRFPDLDQVERAVARWRKQGFNTWWIFAPREQKTEDDAPRRLVRQWTEPAA